MQDGHVVAYESRVLLKAEKSLQIYEKELLAVIHCSFDLEALFVRC